MSYYGESYPNIKLQDGEEVKYDFNLPHPQWRLFRPDLQNDSRMNPVTKNMLERRFGWYFNFTFHWDYIAEDIDIGHIMQVINNTDYTIILTPFSDYSDFYFSVYLVKISLPLMNGANRIQGIEIELKTAELQATLPVRI